MVGDRLIRAWEADIIEAFDDMAPSGQELTAYDRSHIKLYMRLLDAAADGAKWQEVVEILFGIDPTVNPARAQAVHDSHLARAKWLAETGYRGLLRHGVN